MKGGPDFIVIGAMKCATSSLHEQLAAQPGFFMSDPKEPNFFSDPDVWARGLDWYEALFRPGADAVLRGESSTHYTKLPTYAETVDRIAGHLPDARFVYVMRDPIERLVSQYIHEWTERSVDGSIDEAVQRHPHLLAYSCYAMQLRPYLERFGPERVHPVFFEGLRARPQEELERIARFLGYEGEVVWQEGMRAKNVSRDRMRRSPLRDAVTRQPMLAWLRRTLVPSGVRERIKDAWRMKERPELSKDVLDEVVGALDADLTELSRWLGIELDCARFASVAAGARAEWTSEAPRRAS